jgi:mono/diheme cytochrome c family protein
MPSRILTAFALGICLTGALAAGACLTAAPASSTDKLNTKIDLPPIHDAAGRHVQLPEAKATVVMFLSFDCPVSNSYAASLAELAKEYAPKGVTFIGLCPTDAAAAEVANQAKDFPIGFPVYKDERLAVADVLKARTTPEAFVLDRHHILRYRGRVDNGYYARLKKSPQVTSHDLRNALDDLLAGKPVREPATPSVGCAIVRERPAAAANAPVTYHRDVEPIVQKNCQGCHRPGEVGPFALMTYKQAANWASDIKEYTQSHKMPPWKPVDGPAFAHERRLTDRDIATLAAWVDAGCPEGDPNDAPPPAQFPRGWQLGPPDLVLSVPEEFTVGPSGTDLFRCFVLPTGLTEDKNVTAFEVRPGNPRVVHHTLNFLDTTGAARALQKQQQAKDEEAEGLQDYGPGYSVRMGAGIRPSGVIGGWAPGQMPRHLPDGLGYYLPKDSDIVLQVHYHRTGRVEKDRTQIGLYFAKKPVTHAMQSAVVGPTPAGMLTFFIPANAEHHVFKGRAWATADCTLYSVMPHMHLIGREIKVTMTPPEGPTRTLVAIKDWDYNWQETYFFKEPIRVREGTRFDVEAVYDNSRKNPNNPSDPPRPVFFGEQTTNEMCFGFLGVTGDKPGRVRFSTRPPAPPDGAEGGVGGN